MGVGDTHWQVLLSRVELPAQYRIDSLSQQHLSFLPAWSWRKHRWRREKRSMLRSLQALQSDHLVAGDATSCHILVGFVAK